MIRSKESLVESGFNGFERLVSLGQRNSHIPEASGVYVVVSSPTDAPGFLEVSRGGHFKRKDPTVPVETLRQNWVPGAETLYIGKATNLRRRLTEFARYGSGKPVGHRGGRYLWQLADCESLLVGWKLESEPERAEAELIEKFEARYGALPFANLVRGRRPLAAA